jgi:hypothetical protein
LAWQANKFYKLDMNFVEVSVADPDPNQYKREKQDPDPCQQGLDPDSIKRIWIRITGWGEGGRGSTGTGKNKYSVNSYNSVFVME